MIHQHKSEDVKALKRNNKGGLLHEIAAKKSKGSVNEKKPTTRTEDGTSSHEMVRSFQEFGAKMQSYDSMV